MAKKLPLLRRLELALLECDSETTRDTVYGKLYKIAKDSVSSKSDFFYGKLDQNSLSPVYNRKPISSQEVQNGKELANYLESRINLPESGKSKYREKMIHAMDIEFEKLKEYFTENES